MTELRKEEIKALVRAAFLQLGECSETELNRRVESKMEWLVPYCEEEIKLNTETMKGYCLTIGTNENSKFEKKVYNGVECNCETLKALVLFVNDDIEKFIIKTVECYDPVDGSETMYGEPTYEVASEKHFEEKYLPALA